MKPDQNQKGSSEKDMHVMDESWAPQMPHLLHALSNKLLPIVAFSDLGARRCEDPVIREYFDKIRQAAGDSRELITQLRRQFQQNQKELSETYSSSPGGMQAP